MMGSGPAGHPNWGWGGTVGLGAWLDKGDKGTVAQTVPSQRAQGLRALMVHDILGSKQLLQLLCPPKTAREG